MSIYVNAVIRVKVQFQIWKLIIRNTYKLMTTTVSASIETKLSRMNIELKHEVPRVGIEPTTFSS